MSTFNPYPLHAIRIPLGMVLHGGVSWGAKCLYGRLALHRGKKADGFCNPTLKTLAAEMGVDIATIDRWLKQLVSEGFIERKRRGPQCAECFFLDHPCFSDSAILRNIDTPEDSAILRNKEPELDSADLQERLRNSEEMIPQFCGAPYKEENVQENVHENVQSSSGPAEGSAVVTTDDDTPHSQPKPEDLEALVSTARDQLRMARAAGLGVPLDQIGSPDRKITVEILGAFTDYADFSVWLEGTISRHIARKAKDSRWGLYLADAKNQSEDLRLQREREEKERHDAEIERQQQMAAEAEKRRAMDTPVPFADAAAIAGCRVPWVLKLQLERASQAISPNELIRRSRDWKPCSECKDKGIIGDALERNLRFCDCAAGIEAQYRDGADYCEREIARVHADSRSVLVEAFRSAGRDFAADAIEQATVIDDGQHLEIRLAQLHKYCIADTDIAEALQKLHWERTLTVQCEAAA